MARLLINHILPEVKGAGIILTLHVTFHGTDVPDPGDSTAITVELPGTISFATKRQRIKEAISAEAQRLGYRYDGDVLLPALLLLGL